MGRHGARKPRQEKADAAVLLGAAVRSMGAVRCPPLPEGAIWTRVRSNALLQLPRVALDIQPASTSGEPCPGQPKGFREELQLHDFQLPSLGWMLARESGEPISISVDGGGGGGRGGIGEGCGGEGVLDERQVVRLRGGILADGVGFGKTVITLALLDHLRGPQPPGHAGPIPADCFIPSRATVVIAPPNLWKQWNEEAQKFLRPGSLRIISAADIKVLKQCTVGDLAQADLVVLSYRIFDSQQYRERLNHFGGGGQGSRRFTQALLAAAGEQQGPVKDVGPDGGAGRSELPEVLAQLSFPVLELFHFHRIVADEFHELVCAVGQDMHPFHRAMVSLCELHSRSRWGLTSTPPLKTAFELAVTASFFQCDLTALPQGSTEVRQGVLAARCSEFAAHMFRSGGLVPVSDLPELKQHKVTVSLTRHERALYVLAATDGSGSELRADLGTRRLMELASLHRPDAPSARDQATASDLCAEELERRRRPVLQLEADMREAAHRIERQWQLLLLRRERESMCAADPALLLLRWERESMCAEDRRSAPRESQRPNGSILREACDEAAALLVATEELISHVQGILGSRAPTDCRAVTDAHGAVITFMKSERRKAADRDFTVPAQGHGTEFTWTLRDFESAVAQERQRAKRLSDLYMPLLQLQTALAELDKGTTCQICCEEVDRESMFIARCTHILCGHCWGELFAQRRSRELGCAACPFCRQEVTPEEVLPVCGGAPRLLSGGGRGCAELQAQRRMRVQAMLEGATLREMFDVHNLGEFGAYGSKSRSVVLTLERIRREDPQARVLVFVQWEVMKQTLDRAFESFHVPCLNLQGSTHERASLLRHFAEPHGPWVLLLSMEFSPSGLNLVAANHVVLVQPTWHEGSHEKSVDFEEQAIGRCWRQGQDKPVHVWRLCASQTVEEDFVDEHMMIWETRVRRGSRATSEPLHSHA